MKRPSDTLCHWGQTTQLRSCFCGTVQAPDRKLVANANLGRQTAEGSEQAHPSERHVRHSICPLIFGYIAETLWGRTRRPKPKRPQSASSSWSKNAPETRRHVRHEPKNCVSLTMTWSHSSLSGEGTPPEKTLKSRGQLHVRCAFPLTAEIGCCRISLRFSQSQTHVKHPSVSKDKKEERVGAGARSAAEACGLRQEKSRTRWIQRSSQGHEHSTKSDDSRDSAFM